MTTTAQLYRHMIRDSAVAHCWACGAEATDADRPEGWYGPWRLERAHIVSSPRVEDVRLVALLCTICHRRSRGERIVYDGGQRCELPPLRLAHLLWLKRTFDPESYDRAFLQRYSIQKLPAAHRPPLVYRNLYLERHPP